MRHQTSLSRFQSFAPAAALLAAIGLLGVSAPAMAQSAIGPATQAWADQARSGRADLLIIGDSTVLFGGHGFDAGLIKAGASEFGLAGTGLMGASSASGEGHASFFNTNSGFTQVFPATAPSAALGYVWDRAAVAGSTNATFYTSRVDIRPEPLLQPDEAYDWHVYLIANQPDGATAGAYHRLGYSPYTTLQTFPTVTVPFGGVERLSFPATAQATTASELILRQVTHATVLYNRRQTVDNQGITVTSWGYGGKTMLDFYYDRLLSMTQDGRSALLSAAVDGGSGKLNVLVIEGFNDRNETDPSLAGNPDGDSPEAFLDNVLGSINLLRDDWTAGGHDPADLCFTVVGMYDMANGSNVDLIEYADKLRELAWSDPQISFVDLRQATPDFATGDAAGYFADTLHLSALGSEVYGAAMLGELIVPRPGDANADGVVDLQDFVILRNNFGGPGTFYDADFNGDGIVDLEDFVILRNNFGT